MDRLSLLDTEYCFNLAIDSQGLGVISGSFNIPVGQRAVVAVSKDIVSVPPRNLPLRMQGFTTSISTEGDQKKVSKNDLRWQNTLIALYLCSFVGGAARDRYTSNLTKLTIHGQSLFWAVAYLGILLKLRSHYHSADTVPERVLLVCTQLGFRGSTKLS